MLKRPNFALNPSNTLVARGAGYLEVALWWVDRGDDAPICEIGVHGAGVGGVHFPTDEELWVLSSDGWLTSWDVKQLIARAESSAAKAAEQVDAPEAPQDSEADEDEVGGDPADAEAREPGREPAAPAASSAPRVELPEPNWRLRIGADVTATAGLGRMFAIGDTQGRVWLIEGRGDQALVRVGAETHNDAVMALAFAPRALALASSGRDRVIRIWRSMDAEGISEDSLVGAAEVLEFFSVAEPAVERRSSEEKAKLTADEGSSSDEEEDPHEEEASAAKEEVPAAEAEASEQEDATSEEVESRAAAAGPRPAPLRPERRLGGLEGWQVTLAFSPDAQWLATGGVDQGLYLFDLATEDEEPLAIQFAHSGWIADLAWSDDGSTIATGSWDNSIGLFDGSTLEPQVCLQLHRDYVCDVEFRGARLCAASHDREISVWAWREQRLEMVLVGHTDWVEAIELLDRDRLLSVSSDRTARVFQLDTGEVEHVIGAADAMESFQIGTAVDMSEFVDLSGLASHQLERSGSARRYRDYRATGFRTTTEKTALGLLEGAIDEAEPVSVDEPHVPAPSAKALDPHVAPDWPPPESAGTAAGAKAAAQWAEPEPEPQAAAEVAAPEPEPEGEPESESAEPEPAPEPAPEPEPEDEPESAAPEPEPESKSEPASSEAPARDGAPETHDESEPSSREQPVSESATAGESLDEIVPKSVNRTSAEKKQLERAWRREPSIGTTTIRRMTGETDEQGETSITGSHSVVSFDAPGESGERPITMGLGDEPSERFETGDDHDEDDDVESIADPPSVEMGALSMEGELSEAAIDDGWAELEQTVDPSVFRTHSWPKPTITDGEDLPAQTGEWDISLDERSAEEAAAIPDELPPSHDDITAEIPKARVDQLREKSDEISQTGSHEIWERLPSRATPRQKLLAQRAAPGARKFSFSHEIKTPHRFVYGVAISPDGQLVATCGGDDSVCVWTREGDLLHRMRAEAPGLNAVDFSFDGRAIVAGGDDGIVHMWLLPPAEDRTISIEHAALRGHDGWISDVCFSPDGSFVLTGSYDGTARVWKLSTGRCVRTLAGHADVVSGVGIGNTRALSVGYDGSVRVWDQRWTQVDLLAGYDRLLGLSTNGVIAAFCAADGKVFTIRDGRPAPLKEHRGQARDVLVRGDGLIFSVGEEGAIRVYAPDASTPLQSLSISSPAWCLDACRDIAVVGADDGCVHVFLEPA